ncbi:vacuolar iron transporter homolog 2-like [Typha latifolia]|uniref:vacuolar iron transporter homolog 2-like n=1 Tax=Typha latifolia TaxID=4733 RepID=UPI003C2C24FC
MSFRLASQIHVSNSPSPTQPHQVQIAIPRDHEQPKEADIQEIDYSGRAQWLRAAVLGANDGLVSVSSLMIGIGAVNQSAKAMLVSGLAGLVAGACSMAIGEFVSVYAQYDIEVAQMKREREGEVGEGNETSEEERERLPSPAQAAGASALAFAAGAILPLLAGGFIKPWGVRVGVVCAVTSLALAGFGATGAVLGGAKICRSMIRVLLGGWAAMAISYGVLRLFDLAFGYQAAI